MAKSQKTETPATEAKTLNPARYAPTAKITVLAKANPKRPNSAAHALFAAYEKADTVGAYLNAVAKLARRPKAGRLALAWDVKHGYVSVA
jgi:hypothetical protein